MTEILTQHDIPLLRSAGFEAGFSGTTWFGSDLVEEVWQVVLLDDGNLEFRPSITDYSFGSGKPMTREEFEYMFPTGR